MEIEGWRVMKGVRRKRKNAYLTCLIDIGDCPDECII